MNFKVYLIIERSETYSFKYDIWFVPKTISNFQVEKWKFGNQLAFGVYLSWDFQFDLGHKGQPKMTAFCCAYEVVSKKLMNNSIFQWTSSHCKNLKNS